MKKKLIKSTFFDTIILGDSMKKGFTLVELLAVIVILAVIALITIPAVMKIIDNSTRNSYRRSIDMYGKAISNAIIEYKTDMVEKGQKTNITFDNIESYIEYEGNDVDCKIKQIYSDKTILLTNCYVDEELVLGEKNKGYSDENYYYYTNSKKKLKLIEYIKAVEEALIDKNVTATCQVQEDGSITCNGENTKVKSNVENANSGTLVIVNSKVVSYNGIKFATEKKTETNNEIPQIIDEVDTTSGDPQIPKNPGLYDDEYNLVATWDELVNNYELQIVDGELRSVGSTLNRTELSNGTVLVISKDVTSLGGQSFWGCSNLKSVYFEKNSNLQSIKQGVFSNGCENLTNIIIPKSVINIESNIFNYCHKLESIKVEKGNSKYEDRDSNAIIEKSTNTLLAGCKNTTIPNSVTSIGSGAFYGSALTSITIPNSVTSLGSSAFMICNNLTSVIFEENSQLLSLQRDLFRECTNLTNITIPNSVTSIENCVFSSCTNLTNVTFENTDGWMVEGIRYNGMGGYSDGSIDVSNSSTNATNLSQTYRDRVWYKN